MSDHSKIRGMSAKGGKRMTFWIAIELSVVMGLLVYIAGTLWGNNRKL